MRGFARRRMRCIGPCRRRWADRIGIIVLVFVFVTLSVFVVSYSLYVSATHDLRTFVDAVTRHAP